MRVAGINSPILSPTGTMSSTGASVSTGKGVGRLGVRTPVQHEVPCCRAHNRLGAPQTLASQDGRRR